jgi:hypothetical protein
MRHKDGKHNFCVLCEAAVAAPELAAKGAGAAVQGFGFCSCCCGGISICSN